jgi:hypothetical protein
MSSHYNKQNADTTQRKNIRAPTNFIEVSSHGIQRTCSISLELCESGMECDEPGWNVTSRYNGQR